MTMMGVTGPQGAIIRFALRFRGIIVALSGLFVAYGIYTLGRASYDVFPEFAPPQASIQTEAPGLSPEQVEILVTRPIETAINGVPNVDRLISNSLQGLSIVTAYFGECHASRCNSRSGTNQDHELRRRSSRP